MRGCAPRAEIMATTQVIPHQIVPLHLSGNTTDQQNKQLQEFLGAAVQEAYRTAIESDRQSAQTVLDKGIELKSEVAGRVVEIIHRNTASDKYKDEEMGSNQSIRPLTECGRWRRR